MASGGVLEVMLSDSEDIREKKRLRWLVCFRPRGVKKPYVCVRYRDQERTSKVAVGKGKKSIWDQKFEFDVDDTAEANQSREKLVFRVMDKHKLSDDVYVGEATVHVKDVVSMGMEKGKAQLGIRKYRVVRQDKSYDGDISAAVTFKRKDGFIKEAGRKASLVNIEDGIHRCTI